MTCYYPLIGLPRGISSSLTYSCLTHNQRTATALRPQAHRLDLAIYAPLTQGWTCLDRIPLPAAGDLSIDSNDYRLLPGDLLVAVPLGREVAPDPSDPLLPLPYSKKLDRSPVAERCSLGFSWRGVVSSYQGEYPLRMAELEGGSSLCFNALLQDGNSVGMNLLCMVNISRAVDASVHSLEVFEAHSLRRLQVVPYRRNQCCLVEISPEQAGSGEIFFRSTTTLGIPIFLSLSRQDGPASMSVEHTHPPTQFFSDRDRLRGSQPIKRTWLGATLS